jgi:hypothetical protein
MISARILVRFATAIVVVAGCGWTMLRGADYIRLRWSSADLASADDPLQAVAAWRDKTGLASFAIAEALRAPVDAGALDKAHRRETLLSEFLSARPGSSQFWIALAALRYSVGAPTAAVASAFKMSAMTGPNEETAMNQRALFGLLQWDNLPPDIRERAAIDLCNEATRNIGQLRLVVSVKSDAVRTAIRDGLTAGGCAASFLDHIGL